MKFRSDSDGVSPVVATLVLILVAIIGAISVAYIVGALSTDTAKRVVDPFAKATPTPGPQVLIVDSPQTYPLDQQLAQQYMAMHSEVRVTLHNTPDEFLSATSLSENISDIVALSRAPSSSLLFKDPKIQTYFIAGRAVVLIANSNMNIPALSQSDLSRVYSQTPQSIPYNLTSLTTVVRNDDDDGSEYVFSGWLTDGADNSLNNYTATPAGVQNYTAHSEAEVISKVSSTPGAIGFVYWDSVAGNNASESNLNVVPIVNKNNQMVQIPTDSGIRSEMAAMDNTNYDEGLIAGLYYLTEGEPGDLAKGYIDWCQSPDAASILHNMGMQGSRY